MIMAQDNVSVSVDIAGTFDIAVARNRIRQLADQHQLPTILRARASAAITTIAELTLFKCDTLGRSLHLTMTILNDTPIRGIEFQFLAPLTTEISHNLVVAQSHLERTCDELIIKNRGQYDFIIMKLWCSQRLT